MLHLSIAPLKRNQQNCNLRVQLIVQSRWFCMSISYFLEKVLPRLWITDLNLTCMGSNVVEALHIEVHKWD